ASTYLPANTYAYAFTGQFTQGGVYVRFNQGSFATLDGATNQEETEAFNVIGQAASFKMMVAGSVSYWVPFINYELFAIEGQASLTIENNDSDVRFILEAAGSMRMVYLGTIASAAASMGSGTALIYRPIDTSMPAMPRCAICSTMPSSDSKLSFRAKAVVTSRSPSRTHENTSGWSTMCVQRMAWFNPFLPAATRADERMGRFSSASRMEMLMAG
ncbi:MAG: hypothetical protein AAGU05_11770, partial [Anaerolineaceae bacterium]